MSLTGLPLILLTAGLAVVAVVATVRGWRMSGRKRLPLRITGLVAMEVLIVAGIALVANRHDSFYPSWRALGSSENVVTAPSAPVGRLDGTLETDGTITWAPPELAASHLATAPLLIASPEYAAHRNRTFPVIVALAAPGGGPEMRRCAASATGVLTVVLEPTHATTSASLGSLLSLLAEDARAADGLAVVADPEWRSLASGWPGRPPVVAGNTPAAFAAAARELPPSLAAPLRLPS